MPLQIPTFNTFNAGAAINQGNQNALAQQQMLAAQQQIQQRNALAPIVQREQNLNTLIAGMKYARSRATLVNDEPSYQAFKQDMVTNGLMQPNAMPQSYDKGFIDNLTGKLDQHLGQKPSAIQTYEYYQKQHPEYKGDFLQFQTDMANAKTPQGETTPAVTEAYKNGVLQGNMTLRNVPVKDRPAVAIALNNMPKGAFSPAAITKFTQAAERIQSNFIKLPQYQLTANAVPYLQRIDAALKNPGSVSDQDLIDSLTKLTTGGNQVTEQQIKTVTGGKTFGDWLNIMKNRSINQGGVFSDSQRKQIDRVAKTIFQHYQKGWQPVYKKLTSQLTQANIPQQFWSLPDLNQLSAQGGYPMEGQPQGATPQTNPAQQPSIDDLVNKYANP